MNFRVQQPIIQPSHIQSQAAKTKKNHHFKALLRTELANDTQLKISKHAEARFQERRISLSNETWNKIEKAVNKARDKGVTEALVLTNESALVISTKNKLVITALDRKSASEHLFTNINGTIVIDE